MRIQREAIADDIFIHDLSRKTTLCRCKASGFTSQPDTTSGSL